MEQQAHTVARVLRDDSLVRIRTVAADDAVGLRRYFTTRLSQEARECRFDGPDLLDEVITALTDSSSHCFRLVALEDGKIVGEVGFVTDVGKVPELSISVASGRQGLGLGTALLQEVADVAHDRGHRSLEAKVGHGNHDGLRWFRSRTGDEQVGPYTSTFSIPLASVRSGVRRGGTLWGHPRFVAFDPSDGRTFLGGAQIMAPVELAEGIGRLARAGGRFMTFEALGRDTRVPAEVAARRLVDYVNFGRVASTALSLFSNGAALPGNLVGGLSPADAAVVFALLRAGGAGLRRTDLLAQLGRSWPESIDRLDARVGRLATELHPMVEAGPTFRVPPGRGPRVWATNEVEVDIPDATVAFGGDRRNLTPPALRLLAALIRRGGEPASDEDLALEVGDRETSERELRADLAGSGLFVVRDGDGLLLWPSLGRAS